MTQPGFPPPKAPHIFMVPALLPIQEGTRPELVPFGQRNLRGENIRPNRVGEENVRYGFAALPNSLIDATTSTAGYKLFADHNTIVRIADGTAQVFDIQSQTWVPMAGRPSEVGVQLVDLPSLGTANVIEDIAIVNGYLCIAWLATISATITSAYVAVINLATKGLVSAPVQIGVVTNSTTPLMVTSVGNSFVAIRANTAAIKAFALDTTSAATITTGWVAIPDLATNYAGSAGIANASVASLGAYAAIAYANNAGAPPNLTVNTFDTSGVLLTQNITGSTTPQAVDIQGSLADTLWVAWDDNGAGKVRLIGLDPSNINNTPLATTADMMNGGTMAAVSVQSSTTAGEGRLYVTANGATLTAYTRGFKTVAGAAATDGALNTIYNTLPVGRAFLSGTRYYIPVAGGEPGNLQQQVVLADWTDDVTYVRPVAVPAPGLSVTTSVATGAGYEHLRGKVIADGSGKFYFGMSVSRTSVANGATLAEFDFNAASRWQSAASGNSLFLTGGVAQYSDGLRIAETGFLIRPPIPTVVLGGAGVTVVTGWRYACVYEEVDSDGNWHVSGLSSVSASTGAFANKTVTVSTRSLTISSRIRAGASVRVAFYRTLDNGGIAPYYRLGTTINDTSLATVSFADTTTDAILAAGAVLYSQPGVLGTAQDRRPPPFFSCITSYNGMLVGASGSDVWYSGQPVTGEGAWFNPIFQVPVPGDGDITALWALDGALYVAKRRDIFVITGDAPSDNGSTGGLGLPSRLAVDLGCINSRSVCVTSLGAFFQSERGIELFTRARTMQWVGKSVENTVNAFPIVTSATVNTDTPGTVLIELAASESSGLVAGAGRTLVYDLIANDWISTDRRTSVASVVDAPSQSACVVYDGTNYRYAWLATDGSVHVENRDTHLDADGSFVVPLIETGWFNGFQHEQRVWRGSILFQRYTAAGLKVEIAYDYGDYDPLDDFVWTELETVSQRQLEFSPKRRGESMKLRITSTAPATPGIGTGLSVFGIQMDLSGKQGPTKGTVRLDPALRR